ncbi:MAG: ADP-ribosylglycohydrolase family protein [Chloroflexota bacterium]
MSIEKSSRYLGCLLGLACGDAVGTTVEFKPRGSFEEIVDMTGGGPFGLQPGEWTDDTSLALCLAESLTEMGGFDPADQALRYLKWYREGYLSSTGACFDIGNTTKDAIQRFERTGKPNSGSTHPQNSGNGSIMRLAPVPMYYSPDLDQVIEFSGKSSLTTHGAQEAVDGCKLYGLIIAHALQGKSKETVLFEIKEYIQIGELSPKIAAIARGEYRDKNRDEIRGSGYVVASLEAALWCFYHTNSFEEAVLTAVNLGEDTDTTGAVVGQVAGAYYGVEAIPAGWLEKLKYREKIAQYGENILKKP